MTMPYLPPAPSKPSILDRVAARLFPTDAYQGLLAPQEQQDVSGQGLRQLGIGLLNASGPRVVGTPGSGLGERFGQAYGNVNLPQIADQALQLQSYRAQQAQQAAIAQASANHPAQPGETPAGTYARLAQIAAEISTIPGGDAVAAKLAPIMAALKPEKGAEPREPLRITDFRDNVIGSPTHGMIGTVLLDPTTQQRVGFIPQVQASDKPVKPSPQQIQNAEFGAAAIPAWQHLEALRTAHPGVEAEVGQILTSPAFAQAVPFFRNAGDAVQALQKAGASPEAQQYMRAKWAFLDNIIRTRIPGGRMSGQYLSQISQEMMPGLDVEGNAQMRQNELRAILTAQGESGYDLNPAIWNAAVKRQGVQNFDPQQALLGTSGDSREARIRGTYK